ncbi:MAG: hypothetical protein GY820_33260 [Gammaproteobacteria bacterium]|nr:hypothetical protein [Gammaproteobacteria bacterium]
MNLKLQLATKCVILSQLAAKFVNFYRNLLQNSINFAATCREIRQILPQLCREIRQILPQLAAKFTVLGGCGTAKFAIFYRN